MSLSSVAARRPVGTAMLFFCVVMLGVVASRQLAVDFMPEVDMPRVSISTTYEGVAPEEMESLITRPIEQAMSTIEGVDQLDATSSEGISQVSIMFDWGRDLDEAINDIREKLDRVREMLPPDAQPPTLFKFNLSDMPVAFLGLSGGGDARRLRYLADEVLSRRLERIQGIASVDTRGGRVREIQVRLDEHRLAALGITPRQVTQVLGRENRNVSAGDMMETGKEVLIRSVGEFTDVRQIADTVVTTRDGRPIFVHDLGTVEDTFQDIKNDLSIDGAAGMRLYVQKQSGANTVEVAERLRAEIANINRDYEGRLQVTILMDSSEFIRSSVSNVQRGALFGAVLAVFVLIVFLRDGRATLIVATAIPISVLATVALMYFNGFTLNVISLGGIALGIGMLVDSAIVVLENIYRKRHEGHGALDSAIEGSREVSLAILAGTLTTIAVFVPVVFIQGMAGIFFKEMAVVVSFALICSLAVALTLIPAAAAKWLPEPGEGQRFRHEAFGGVLEKAGNMLRALDGAYGRVLERALRHPWRVVGISVTMFVLSFLAIPLVGFELMPETDEGRMRVSVELEVGTPVETTMVTMQDLELRLRNQLADGELEHLITNAGPEGFWRPASGNQGTMDVMLTPVTERQRGVDNIIGAFRQAASQVPGADIRIYPSSSNMMMGMMRGGSERLSVEIRGHDLGTADRLANRILQVLESVPGVAHPRIDRDNGQLERALTFDRKRLAELGLSGTDVAETVEHFVLGRVATRYRDGGNEYDVRVQLHQDNRELVEQLPQLPVVTASGDVVPLGALAQIDERTGPTSINRRDQERFLRVTAGFSGRPFSDVVRDVRAGLENLEIPEGFSAGLGGEVEEQREVFADLLLGLALAIFLVFTVMAIQFESLLHPLIIMTAVPFSFIGMVLSLLVTGTTLNMNSILGVIVLIGIVVNNAIVLVDYVNLLRRERDLSLMQALVQGGARRLRPILMTTLTTALGLMPLAIGLGEGSEIQVPMARVVIGGLLTSTLITLLFVPSLYLIVERRKAARTERRAAAGRARTGWAPGPASPAGGS
ncbi:MAG: efflux RND transporter permease subunit [Acidobacteriota bacterium]|nr:efflux RND transporter permease subunit [Acidobacteriota bacterium]